MKKKVPELSFVVKIQRVCIQGLTWPATGIRVNIFFITGVKKQKSDNQTGKKEASFRFHIVAFVDWMAILLKSLIRFVEKINYVFKN